MRYSLEERENMIGQKSNYLEVIGIAEPDKKKNFRLFCRCECGKITTIRYSRLKTTISCGCKHKPALRHGGKLNGKESLTYKSWHNMKSRCLNRNDPYYYRYGGRGIGVFPLWISSFETFLLDMGERPKGKTLDRINMNGNYEPSNCRWATMKEQNRNHPNVKISESIAQDIRMLRSKNILAKEIAHLFGISTKHVYEIQHMRSWI